MPVRFNKSVLIRNPRLECLYLFFCVWLAVFLVAKFVYRQEFLIFYESGDGVRLSLEPWVVERAEMQRIYDGKTDTCARLDSNCVPLCQSGGDWAYQFGSSPNPFDHTPTCALPEHLAFTLSGSLMFPTSVKTQQLVVNNATMAYYPYEEAVGLRFRLSVSYPTLSPRSLISDSVEEASHVASSGSHDLHVTLLDHSGNIYRVVDDSSEAIEMSLMNVLEMSSLGLGYLDAEQGQGRATGASLRLVTECYDRPAAKGHLRPAVFNEIKGSRAKIFCTARVVVAAETSPMINGPYLSATRQTINGLTVGAYTGGYMSQFSIVSILDSLVQAMVYGTLPKFLAFVVAVKMLGHLSRIYESIIHEVFDIAEQVAGTAVRVASNTAAFEELCDHEQSFISKETLLRRIKLANPSGRIAEDELELFVDFSHKVLLDMNNYTQLDTLTAEVKADAQKMFRLPDRSFGHRCCRRSQRRLAVSRRNSARAVCDGYGGEEVGMDNFTRGCSSIDKLHILDTIHLFSRRRRVMWLERFFMPAYIRKFYVNTRVSVFDDVVPTALASIGIKPEDSLSPTTPDQRSEISDPSARHRTQGSKALNKTLELESRYQDLEKLSSDFVLADDLHGHLESHAERFERSLGEIQRSHSALESLFKAHIPRANVDDSSVVQTNSNSASSGITGDSQAPRDLVVKASTTATRQEKAAGVHASSPPPVREPAPDQASCPTTRTQEPDVGREEPISCIATSGIGEADGPCPAEAVGRENTSEGTMTPREKALRQVIEAHALRSTGANDAAWDEDRRRQGVQHGRRDNPDARPLPPQTSWARSFFSPKPRMRAG